MLITHSADARVRQRGRTEQKKTKTPNQPVTLRGQVTIFTISNIKPFSQHATTLLTC